MLILLVDSPNTTQVKPTKTLLSARSCLLRWCRSPAASAAWRADLYWGGKQQVVGRQRPGRRQRVLFRSGRLHAEHPGQRQDGCSARSLDQEAAPRGVERGVGRRFADELGDAEGAPQPDNPQQAGHELHARGRGHGGTVEVEQHRLQLPVRADPTDHLPVARVMQAADLQDGVLGQTFDLYLSAYLGARAALPVEQQDRTFHNCTPFLSFRCCVISARFRSREPSELRDYSTYEVSGIAR